MEDPNPEVSGRGGGGLREAGMGVHRGLAEAQAREVNRGFCRWVVSGKPFVTVKLAVSLDGQIAASGGDYRWIPGGAAGGRIFLAVLGSEGVTSLLVEGGGRVAGWLAEEGAVDRYVVFVAPLLLGEGIRAIT